MKNKKYNLFITSDDVTNFGRTFSISKFSIYALCLICLVFIFFSLPGFYYVFFSKEDVVGINKESISSKKNIVNKKTIKSDANNLVFHVDPVSFKHKNELSDHSFITRKFSQKHHGIDINGDEGREIYTPMSGVVIHEGFDREKGHMLIIEHDNGYVTKYMHNKKNLVYQGESVKAGDKIAKMGASGNLVSGKQPHLQFELWKDQEPVDPFPFIKELKLIQGKIASNRIE